MACARAHAYFAFFHSNDNDILTPRSPKAHPTLVSISGAGNSGFGLLARHLRSMDSSRRETGDGLFKCEQAQRFRELSQVTRNCPMISEHDWESPARVMAVVPTVAQAAVALVAQAAWLRAASRWS